MKPHLQALLRSALEPVLSGTGVSAPAAIAIAATKDTKHGDFATNVALALAKALGKPPRVVAELIQKNLPASSRVAKTEIAGPGFINFFLAAGAFQAVVPEILARMHTRGDGRLAIVEPPFEELVLAEGYWFAADRLSDPAHRWLFGRLDAVAAELAAG